MKTRLYHVLFLLKDLLLIPLWTSCWYLDELFYAEYKKVQIKGILLLVGQPRSGTTFLHRTICEDSENFTGVRHYEWRYPFLCLNHLVNIFKLNNWLEKRNYWSSTNFGQIASQMHSHTLGDFEEDGIFFEERFWHHYFVFRRFPYPKLLPNIASFSSRYLSCKEREKMINTHSRVLRKVLFRRGSDAYIVLKENESVDLINMYINHNRKLKRSPRVI